MTRQPGGVSACLPIDSYGLWSEPGLPYGAPEKSISVLFLNKANTAGEVLFLEGLRSWCVSSSVYEHCKWPTLAQLVSWD